MLLGIYIVVGVINILGNIHDYNIPNTPELRDIRVRRSADNFGPYAADYKAQNVKRIFNGEYFKERAKRSYSGYQQAGYVNQVNTSWNNGFYPGYFNGSGTVTPGLNGYNTASGRNYSNGSYVYPGYLYPVYYPYPNGTFPGYQVYQIYMPYPNLTYPGYSQYPGNQYPGYSGYIPYPNNTYTGYKPPNNQYPGINQYPGYNNANYNTNGFSPYNNTGYGYPIPVLTTPGYNASNVTSTTPRIDKSCIICNIGCPQFMKRLGLFCVKDDDDY